MRDLIKYSNNYICHYGVLGMHWGIRRYQPYPKSYSGSGKFVGKSKNVEKKVKETDEYTTTKYAVKDADGNTVSKANVYDFKIDGFNWNLIADVETKSQYRGQGLASNILKNAIKDSKGKNGLYLMVKQDNKNAINLYKKLNFDTVKEYTMDDKDYYVMATGDGDLKKLKNMNFS